MHIDRSTTGRHTHSRVVSLTKWRGCLISIDIVWPCMTLRYSSAGGIDRWTNGQQKKKGRQFLEEHTNRRKRSYLNKLHYPTQKMFEAKWHLCWGTPAGRAQFRLQIEPNSAMEECESKDGCLFLRYVFRLKNWRCFCVIDVIHLVCLAMFLFFIEALRSSRDLCAEPPPSFSTITSVCIESRTNKQNMQTYVHSSFVFEGRTFGFAQACIVSVSS